MSWHGWLEKIGKGILLVSSMVGWFRTHDLSIIKPAPMHLLLQAFHTMSVATAEMTWHLSIIFNANGISGGCWWSNFLLYMARKVGPDRWQVHFSERLNWAGFYASLKHTQSCDGSGHTRTRILSRVAAIRPKWLFLIYFLPLSLPFMRTQKRRNPKRKDRSLLLKRKRRKSLRMYAWTFAS